MTANDPPFDNRDGYIWFNGNIMPWRTCQVHMLTHALHYGGAVFEGIRAYDGQCFKLNAHSERLIRSANMLDMTLPYTAEHLNEACREILKLNQIKNGYVRPLAWRGCEEMGLSNQRSSINVAIAAWSWPSYFSDDLHKTGIKMIVSPWRRPPATTAPVHAKASGLYVVGTLSKNMAERQGAHDALFYDYRGFVAEGTGANIFMVQEGKLHTPIPDCFLSGITRQTVITLAQRRGIEVIERQIRPEELANASEVFLTGTAIEITPIAEIESSKFTVGLMTQRLADDYREETLKKSG